MSVTCILAGPLVGLIAWILSFHILDASLGSSLFVTWLAGLVAVVVCVLKELTQKPKTPAKKNEEKDETQRVIRFG